MKKIIYISLLAYSFLNANNPITVIKSDTISVTGPNTMNTTTTKASTGQENNAPASSSTSYKKYTTSNGTPQDDDILYGGGKKNKIYAKAGDDYIHPVDVETYDNTSKYYGDSGNDWIELSRGVALEAYGGDGEDVIVNYQGANYHKNYKLYGGDGNDKFYSTFNGIGDIFDGGAGLDTIILKGSFSENYKIYYNNSTPKIYTFYYKESSKPTTWSYDSKFQIKNIESWIWTPTGLPPENGESENVTKKYYITPDKSTSLSTTPTNTYVATLPTVTQYKVPINIKGTTSQKVIISLLPGDTTYIADTNGNDIGALKVKQETDDNDNTTGVIKKSITISIPSNNYDVNIFSNRTFTTTEIKEIKIKAKLGF